MARSSPPPGWRRRLERLGGHPLTALVFLAGGSTGEVWKAVFANGAAVVVKTAAMPFGFEIEAWMLRYLAARSALPLPRILDAAPDWLVLEYVSGGDPITAAVEEQTADVLAVLHRITGPSFGLERDGMIGALPQPNGWHRRWVDFLRERRLLAMGRAALEAGGMSAAAFARLQRLCDRLESLIPEPAAPTLIHGDLWAGNIVVRQGRLAALIDPAPYYASPEIELAYLSFFGGFGARFFTRYGQSHPLERAFFRTRRPLYRLYPLLIHACLFGGDYGARADAIVRRYV